MSTTFTDVSDRIFAAVNSGITQALKVPVALPNVPFTVPNPRGSWCRLHIDWRTAADEIIGRARIRGDVVVSVFVPIGTGARAALHLAEQVRDVFRAADSGPLVFEEVRIQPVTSGAGVEAGWFQTNVRAAFFADEVN